MKDVICPLDGQPCEKDCPDRYTDYPGGGCVLTTVQELGMKIIDLGHGNIGMMFIFRNSKSQTGKASLLAYIEAMDEEKDGRMLRQLDAILYRYFEKKEGPKNDQ